MCAQTDHEGDLHKAQDPTKTNNHIMIVGRVSDRPQFVAASTTSRDLPDCKRREYDMTGVERNSGLSIFLMDIPNNRRPKNIS